jgi:predicted TIM-barrel fold metal-dependent hydrolase
MIDFHTHIFSPFVRGHRNALAKRDPFFSFVYADPEARMVGVEELIAAMEEGGVQQSVVCGSPWQDVELVRRENDYLLESAHKYRQQIIPFINLPHGEEAAIAELERCCTTGARGVGELAPGTYGDRLWPIANMQSLFAAIKEKGLPVLIHVNEPVGHRYPGKGSVRLAEIEALISALQGIPAILAHWGGGVFFYELMPEVAAMCREIYYDTAASPFLYNKKIYKTAIGIVGPDRIVFGSDYPLILPERYKREMQEAGLQEEELEAILLLNAQKLLEK